MISNGEPVSRRGEKEKCRSVTLICCCGPVRSSRTVPGKEIPESGRRLDVCRSSRLPMKMARSGQLWGPGLRENSNVAATEREPFGLITETKAEEI